MKLLPQAENWGLGTRGREDKQRGGQGEEKKLSPKADSVATSPPPQGGLACDVSLVGRWGGSHSPHHPKRLGLCQCEV